MKRSTRLTGLLLTAAAVIMALMNFNFTTSDQNDQEKVKVTLADPDNGTYSVEPEIPEDGMVEKGTVLRVEASPASGYSLDAIYYTVKGGMWGTTSFESFKPSMEITVDKDMVVGATFIPSDLVSDLNVIQDIVYAKPGKKALKYDIYSPENADGLPIIVIIHGGGWSSNNEDIMRGLARELAKGNRYVVASIDYRWINKLDGDSEPNYMHQLIEDVFGAIAHIQEHAEEYGGDPDRIAVTGDSAGGHLSAAAAVFGPMIGDGGFGEKPGVYEFMPTYIPEGKTVEQVRAEITGAVKAAAPSYGPFNAADFSNFIAQKDQAYLDAVSPIKHVPDATDRAIPHFMVRGTMDPLIPDEAVQGYADVLTAHGQKAVYIQVEGAGHAFFDWKPDSQTRNTFARYGVPYAEDMREFFDEVFYN
ncbi:MAG: alpha/beta hydrolase [Cyclobacteriaceae bacterium]